ncbi:nuclear transport factor 2 family protein [Arcobacter sp. LA11]|uniref:nuclear transport factor 2 family protein n=1 Tax=Arcobacter sp. LA11 TaxID=1898176 RepID=UPI0009353685|nr:nuclear transport factor 2 family protein [Arcobacter sp. LA11]
MNKARYILQKWIDSINSADTKKLLSLYNEKAVLIPTFSNRLLDTKEKIKEYFGKVGKKKQLSISLHDNTVITQEIENQIFAITGIYTWRFAIDGELFNFEARFSYLLDISKNSPILNHHSSQIPRTL